MSDKIDMIYDIIKADRDDASDFRKEVRDSHKDAGKRLSILESQGQVQNAQLAEHMKRTGLLEDLHGMNADQIKTNSGKITELERPRMVLSTLKKWLIGVALIAGALTTIYKFINLK